MRTLNKKELLSVSGGSDAPMYVTTISVDEPTFMNLWDTAIKVEIGGNSYVASYYLAECMDLYDDPAVCKIYFSYDYKNRRMEYTLFHH